MVFALPENAGSARRRARPSHPLLPSALGKSLRAMAGEHSGLVHQSPGMVGTPDTGVYRRSQNPSSKSQTVENIYVEFEPPPDKENWVQDPDTLDTWFSSWLWAYETMDEETGKKFYPTSVLVTAPDIIFFWVARMIIAGLEFKPAKSERDEGNIPFHDVFFTGIIRDKQGRKMSKSLGNSPDPLELIDKYGADGLRFG